MVVKARGCLKPFFTSHVTGRLLDLMRFGTKTVEGRLNRGKYCNVTPGSIVKFIDFSDCSNEALCVVIRRVEYCDFKTMLQEEGLNNCLPDIHTIDEGVEFYHGLPGYAENVRTYQVVALKISCVIESNSNNREP